MKTSMLLIPIGVCCTVIFLCSQLGSVPALVPWLSPSGMQIMGHLGLYFCLGFFTAWNLWALLGPRTVIVLVLTADLCVGFGIYDEFHQSFIQGRGVEFFDVVTDLLGGFAGGLAFVVLANMKRAIWTPLWPREQR